MMYRHVFLVGGVIHTIRDETRDNGWLETGGALAGYVSADNALVVTHASGPGPSARKRPWSITVDGTYTTRFCNRVYATSEGRFDYVGDWHLHLGWSPAHSAGDVAAMYTVAASGACAAPYPISLIYSLRRDALIVYAYADGALAPVDTSIINAIPT
jgi:integrative and conjugative element protein (TIGR02256 family)